MVNTKKYKNRFVTSLPVEKEYYDRYNQLLPKGISVADEFNKFMVERVQELEKEKNRDASMVVEASPVTSSTYRTTQAHNTTLDEYITVYEDETRRCKDFYYMDQKNLYQQGQQLSDILDEICCILSEKYKVHFAFGRKVDYNKKLKIKSLVYGGGGGRGRNNGKDE